MSVSNISTHIQTGGPVTNQPLQKGTEKTGSTLQEIGGYCSAPIYAQPKPNLTTTNLENKYKPYAKEPGNPKNSPTYTEKNTLTIEFIFRPNIQNKLLKELLTRTTNPVELENPTSRPTNPIDLENIRTG